MIDILDIAAIRLCSAQSVWYMTRTRKMFNPNAFERKWATQARVALMLAEKDLARVERLIMELSA